MPLIHEARCDNCNKREPIKGNRHDPLGQLGEVPEGWLIPVVAGRFNETDALDSGKPVLCSWGCLGVYAERRQEQKPHG